METVADTPLNVTVDEPWLGPKKVPATVTAVPTVPDAGVRREMTGGFTVNVLPAELPTDVMTTTGPVVAPAGTVHLILVLDHVETVADTPLNVTVDEPWLGPK